MRCMFCCAVLCGATHGVTGNTLGLRICLESSRVWSAGFLTPRGSKETCCFVEQPTFRLKRKGVGGVGRVGIGFLSLGTNFQGPGPKGL